MMEKIKLYFHNVYSSAYIIAVMKIKENKMGEHIEYKGETRNAYKILVGKGKRSHGRRRCRWKVSVKMDF
jgi:hypothetical protein